MRSQDPSAALERNKLFSSPRRPLAAPASSLPLSVGEWVHQRYKSTGTSAFAPVRGVHHRFLDRISGGVLYRSTRTRTRLSTRGERSSNRISEGVLAWGSSGQVLRQHTGRLQDELAQGPMANDACEHSSLPSPMHYDQEAPPSCFLRPAVIPELSYALRLTRGS